MNEQNYSLKPYDGSEPTFSSMLSNFSMDAVFWVLFRHKWKILACLALGVFAALVLIAGAPPPRYRSESMLLVRFVRENVEFDTASRRERIIADESWDRVVNSEIELLKSRELAEEVVHRLHAQPVDARVASGSAVEVEPDRDPLQLFAAIGSRVKAWIRQARGMVSGEFRSTQPKLSARERAIMTVAGNLEAEVANARNIIHVRYEAECPIFAENVLRELIAAYLEKHRAVHSAEGSREFFVSQADMLRDELDAKQEELRQLRDEFEVASLDSKRDALTRRMAELESDRERRQAAMAGTAARLDALNATLADLDTRLSASTDIPGLHTRFVMRTYDRLIQLQLEEEDLLATYTEQSIPVRNVRQKIDRIKSVMEQGDPNVAGPDFQVTSAHDAYNRTFLALLEEQENHSAYHSQIDELNRQLADARGELRRLNEAQMRVGREEHNAEILRLTYRRYVELAEQARIDQARQAQAIDNISVVQAATTPYAALPSSLPWQVALALLLGLSGGIGAAILCEYVLDRSIKTREDVARHLHLRELAVIPRIRRGHLVRARNASLQPQLQQSDGLSAAGVWNLPVHVKDYYDTLAEMLLACTQWTPGKPVTIGVTSWSRNEGVSTVAVNLGVTLAEYDGRVLLVESDIRHPTAHEIFGQVASPSLTEIDVDGVGRATVLQHNLFLLPAHELSGRHEQVSVPQKRCNEMMTHFRDRQDYGFVVVDMPPLCEGAAALRLARMTDNIVMVVEAERNSRDEINRGLEMLARVNGNVVGAVLNKRRRHIPRILRRSS